MSQEKINRKLDCNLLVVTSQNIILCLEKKLQMFDFKGKGLSIHVSQARGPGCRSTVSS